MEHEYNFNYIWIAIFKCFSLFVFCNVHFWSVLSSWWWYRIWTFIVTVQEGSTMNTHFVFFLHLWQWKKVTGCSLLSYLLYIPWREEAENVMWNSLSHEGVPGSNLHLKYVKSREALFFFVFFQDTSFNCSLWVCFEFVDLGVQK